MGSSQSQSRKTEKSQKVDSSEFNFCVKTSNLSFSLSQQSLKKKTNSNFAKLTITPRYFIFKLGNLYEGVNEISF